MPFFVCRISTMLKNEIKSKNDQQYKKWNDFCPVFLNSLF